MIDRDLGDIIDRWSIAKLKSERIGTPDNKKEFEEFSRFLEERKKKYPQYDVNQWASHMITINDAIWQLESGVKSNREKLVDSIYLFSKKNNAVLSRIGMTTVLIRNYNNLRVSFKNIVNKVVGEGFQDVKKDHGSE